MSVELLRVTNFAGITDAEISLGRMNIFIGPQASGKSVCAKLFFYFKNLVKRIARDVVDERTKPQMRAMHRDLFLKYFPPANWGTGIFVVEYTYGDLTIHVERSGEASTTISIEYSQFFDELLRACRKLLKPARQIYEDNGWEREPRYIFPLLNNTIDKWLSELIGSTLTNFNYFIPAGRSFFSTLQVSVFSFIADQVGIDPFLAEFGRLYENVRRINETTSSDNSYQYLDSLVTKILCGDYERIKGHDFIAMSKDRQVSIENSSSGQQEALPLVVVLSRMSRMESGARSTFFIEEPEAHLYPAAQREIVHFVSTVFNQKPKIQTEVLSSQYVITTHSPYILSALNNLMYAKSLLTSNPDHKAAVESVLGGTPPIDPGEVRAYLFSEGEVRSIIDPESKLINAAELDSVSGELAVEFEHLMAIDFAETEH